MEQDGKSCFSFSEEAERDDHHRGNSNRYRHGYENGFREIIIHIRIIAEKHVFRTASMVISFYKENSKR